MVSSCTDGKLRLLSLRDQQVVERLVRRVQRLAQRQFDGAAAFGARVTRGEPDFREVTRARFIERGRGSFDLERLRAQREIRLQSFAHVFVDDRGQRTARFGRGCPAPGRSARAARASASSQAERPTTLSCLVAGRMSNRRRKQSMSQSPSVQLLRSRVIMLIA